MKCTWWLFQFGSSCSRSSSETRPTSGRAPATIHAAAASAPRPRLSWLDAIAGVDRPRPCSCSQPERTAGPRWVRRARARGTVNRTGSDASELVAARARSSRRIARPASSASAGGSAPAAPRPATRASGGRRGSRARACGRRRRSRAASRTAPARAPPAAPPPAATRTGSSGRGRARRSRTRAPASRPRGRTGSSGGARTASSRSARRAASGSRGRRARGGGWGRRSRSAPARGAGRPSPRSPRARQTYLAGHAVEAAAVGARSSSARRSRAVGRALSPRRRARDASRCRVRGARGSRASRRSLPADAPCPDGGKPSSTSSSVPSSSPAAAPPRTRRGRSARRSKTRVRPVAAEPAGELDASRAGMLPRATCGHCAGSGSPRRGRGTRRASPGGSRRTPWACWSTSADACSVLREVTLLLECLVLRGVGRPLRAADGEVRLRRATGRARRARTPSAASASSASACVSGRRDSSAVALLCRSAWPDRPSTGPPASSRPRSSPSRPAAISPPSAEVRVAARVGGLELGVRRRLLAAAETEGRRIGASRLS